MIFTGFWGLLFIVAILAMLFLFVKFYVIPRGLFDRKGNVIQEPDILAVALDKKNIANMQPIEVENILVIGNKR